MKKKKKYLSPVVTPLSSVAFAQICNPGVAVPAIGCQSGGADSVLCSLGLSVGAAPCSNGSSASGGCSGGVMFL